MRSFWLLPHCFCSISKRRLASRRLYSSIALIEELEKARSTDEFLKLARDNDGLDPSKVSDLLKQALPEKGARASALHAWLGHYYLTEEPDSAISLYENFDDVQPDLVTYSLLYAATNDADFLVQAEKLAKKQGGSQRRKHMAALKRKKGERQERIIKLQAMWPDFDILHEDDQLLVVNKPSSVACYHERIVKGHHDDVSLVDALDFVELSTINLTRGLVHRIDRGTSGCLVLAKTNEAHATLVTEFFIRRNKKEYIAAVEGTVEKNEGTVDVDVGGKPALSFFGTLKTSDSASLVQVQTKTGRRHQVRCHCAQGLGTPILGDAKYGAKETDMVPEQRFLLHASKVSIPTFAVSVKSPLPPWWIPILEAHNLN